MAYYLQATGGIQNKRASNGKNAPEYVAVTIPGTPDEVQPADDSILLLMDAAYHVQVGLNENEWCVLVAMHDYPGVLP